MITILAQKSLLLKVKSVFNTSIHQSSILLLNNNNNEEALDRTHNNKHAYYYWPPVALLTLSAAVRLRTSRETFFEMNS